MRKAIFFQNTWSNEDEYSFIQNWAFSKPIFYIKQNSVLPVELFVNYCKEFDVKSKIT